MTDAKSGVQNTLRLTAPGCQKSLLAASGTAVYDSTETEVLFKRERLEARKILYYITFGVFDIYK